MSPVILDQTVISSEILTPDQVSRVQKTYNIQFVMDVYVNQHQTCLFCSRPPDHEYYHVDRQENVSNVIIDKVIQCGVQSQFDRIHHEKS